MHVLMSQPESNVAVLAFGPVCGVSSVEASARLSSGAAVILSCIQADSAVPALML